MVVEVVLLYCGTFNSYNSTVCSGRVGGGGGVGHCGGGGCSGG